MERELHQMRETELAQLFRSHLKDEAKAPQARRSACYQERTRFEDVFKARGLDGLLARCYQTERQHQHLRKFDRPSWN